MKNKLVATVTLGMLALFSCGTAQNKTSNSTESKKSENTTAPTEETMQNTTQDSTTNAGGRVTAIESYNGTTGGNMNVNTGTSTSTSTSFSMSEMYQDLRMTDAQIRNFQMAMTKFREKKRTSPNGEMMGTIASEQDRQLKKILREDQWEAYGTWKSEH